MREVDGKTLHLGDIVELVECDQSPALVGRRSVIAHSGFGGASDETITVTFDDPVVPGYTTRGRAWRVVELGSRRWQVNRTPSAMACSICWRRARCLPPVRASDDLRGAAHHQSRRGRRHLRRRRGVLHHLYAPEYRQQQRGGWNAPATGTTGRQNTNKLVLDFGTAGSGPVTITGVTQCKYALDGGPVTVACEFIYASFLLNERAAIQ
ncbi:MAG: hypothetical protein ACXWQR_01155 [Ktedonobacterales bacterium]